MNAWQRRRQARWVRKQQAAYRKLHGVGAVSRSPKRRNRADGEDLGEFLVDMALLFPRDVLWVLSKLNPFD